MNNKLSVFIDYIRTHWHRFWRWYKALYTGTPWWKKTLAACGTFIVVVLLYCFAVVFNLFWLFGKSPSISEILHPKTPEASEYYSADGVLLGRYFAENRQPVPYDSIAPCFRNALISTEDERFYSHHGIDFVGLFAAVKDATQGHARGASTITQQLVKNMFRVRTQYSTGLLGKIPGVKILIMKSKEMIIATELELLCTKEEILQMYANTVDFGSNAFGIKTAAKTYFGTTPSQLKAEEAAVLVGLLKATSYYNPKINPKNALARRNVVLDNMYTHGMLNRQQRDSLQQLPIELKFRVENAYDGLALYFRQAVADEIKRKCPDLDPYRDGLKIYTTLDSRMQRYAEEAVKEKMKVVQQNFRYHWGTQNPWVDEHNVEVQGFAEAKIRQTDVYRYLAARFPDQPDSIEAHLNRPHMVHLFDYDNEKCETHNLCGHDEVMSSMDSLRYMLRFMHTGFVAIEPHTGHVKAYVGDLDFKTWKYDKVAATHQPGSTFKLFVYAAGMKSGRTPSYRIKDDYIEMKVMDHGKEVIWRPHNADGCFTYAEMPLRAAFARSVNTVAVKLGQEVGISNVISTAHDMGIKSELANAPSLPLGSSDVSVLELVSGYTTVANNGVHIEPTMVTCIKDRHGNIVYQAKPESHRALDERSAYYMQVLLEAGCHDGGGTSMSLNGYIGKYWPRIDYGGKTGTSNAHADAWFVATTPSLVAGAWVGGEYRNIHFRTGALGQGSKTALPVVGRFLEKVLDDPKLQPKYLKKYGKPQFDVNPADIDGSFQYESADTLDRDSLALDEDFFDGMDVDDADDPQEAEAPAEVSE